VALKAKGFAHPRARIAANDHRLDLRQLAFGVFRILKEQSLANDHSQDRVAEEFHPLVGGEPMLHARSVREGRLEQLRIAKGIRDSGLASFKIAAQIAGAGNRFCTHRNGTIAEASLTQPRPHRGTPLQRQSPRCVLNWAGRPYER
jgi:hypothetical protein